jgi:hypothetical protein
MKLKWLENEYYLKKTDKKTDEIEMDKNKLLEIFEFYNDLSIEAYEKSNRVKESEL